MAHEHGETLRQMDEKKRFDDAKLKQLRDDVQAGIASGDAGTLDVEVIKRRARARHADSLRTLSEGTIRDRNKP